MFQELKLSSKEIKNLVLTIIFITIIFSYNDRSPEFVWNFWLKNLLLVFCIVTLILLVYITGIKIMSSKQGNRATFLGMDSKPDFLRAIISVALMLISNGLMYLTSIYSIKDVKVKKLGQHHEKEKETEMALALFSGLFFTLILMLIFNYFNIYLGILISVWFLAWNLVPIASSTGTDLFFFCRPLYYFSILFFPLTIILSLTLSSIISLILSLFFSSLILIYILYKFESGIA